MVNEKKNFIEKENLKKKKKRKIEEKNLKEEENLKEENVIEKEKKKKKKKEKKQDLKIEKKNFNTFRKNFYEEYPSLINFTEKEIENFRKQFNISISDQQYKPIRNFEETSLPPTILENCKEFQKPTPIQSQCWPVILSGRDVIGIAETGSGKTLTFVLPAIVHINDQPSISKKEGPIVLILSPTRELAMQIAEVCIRFGKNYDLRSVCVYGGISKELQYKKLKKGVHFIIATPGRLLDLMNEGKCKLNRVTYLVLDEADRMLDLGFEKDIRNILENIRKDRQTLMFSATWPTNIQQLANEFLTDPVKVTIGSPELTVNHNVTQIVEIVDPYQKDQKLKELLNKYHSSKKNRILVFVLYKKEAERVEKMLQKNGWKVQAIHGDKNQINRTQALQTFKDGTQPLLIATDVAARGLDIPNVEYVINYTFPLTIEDYIHRIGRTGRAGKKGISYTLFTQYDKSKAAELVHVLRESNQIIPEELMKFCNAGTKKKEHSLYGNHFKEISSSEKSKHIKFSNEEE